MMMAESLRGAALAGLCIFVFFFFFFFLFCDCKTILAALNCQMSWQLPSN